MKLDREKYESDESFFEAMVEGEMEYAKQERYRTRYTGTGENSIENRITLIGPDFQCAHLQSYQTQWTDEKEKRQVMAKIAYLACVIEAKGVMLLSDMRRVNSEGFQQHFSLSQHEDVANIDERKKLLLRDWNNVMMHYGHSMLNLPRHLWSEALLVALKTPTKTYTRVQSYTRGDYDSVMWVPSQEEPRSFEAYVIPNWWDIPEDDPTLQKVEKTVLEFLKEFVHGKER